MTGSETLVLLAGIAAIAWVNWYFFLAPRSTQAARTGADGVQELSVTVRGGYDPAVLTLRHGIPTRITFDRQETSSCSEEVVFPALGIKRFLPAFEKTTIELQPPEQPGRYDFTCGMGMLHGQLLVE